jgi:hypothetical protein
MLNSILNQLSYRYNLTIDQIKDLITKKTAFETETINANAKIDTLKVKISDDFQKNDAIASVENINTYLELKNQYYYARTYIIYINQFLKDYQALNEYTK